MQANIVDRSTSLEAELLTAINQGRFAQYMERGKRESELFMYGEGVGWNRDLVIGWLVERQTINFPQSRYENAFDSGWMKVQARTYHQALAIYKGRE